MADPAISEIKYLGGGTLDFLEVRIPDDYPDPQNLRLVIYDRTHNGSDTASPSASDIYNVTADGLLCTEDLDGDMADDDGILHYTFGTSENGTTIFLHAQDAVGLYNAVTGETYGLFNWSGSPYTVSTATGDPFAGQTADLLDNSGQVSGVTSLELQPDGNFTLNTTPDSGSSFMCFTPGTRILTSSGERPIEHLRVGDSVITKDHGPQRICWLGRREFSNIDPAHSALVPIAIKAHAFGHNVPYRDTVLSPNHAVLNAHWAAPLHFGESEVLTTAKSFLWSDHAEQRALDDVTYIHILLDQHSLISANGLWCETLYLGSQCMQMLSPAFRFEVAEALPQIRGDLSVYGPKVRHELSRKEALLLL